MKMLSLVLLSILFLPIDTFGGGCQLPGTLNIKFEDRFPGYSIVTHDKLSEVDLKLFSKDHGDNCPGVVEICFCNNSRKDYAVVLINKSEANSLFVLCKFVHGQWDIEVLEEISGTMPPVVWVEPPGFKEDLSGDRVLYKSPSLLLVGYESWAILYNCSDGELIKKWITD